jgi:solute carrier family 25 phosphate transporter 3
MQTAAAKKVEFPKSTFAGLGKIKGEEGVNGLYKGLGPLWGRQVPYTIVKFVAFEQFVELFYTKVFT